MVFNLLLKTIENYKESLLNIDLKKSLLFFLQQPKGNLDIFKAIQFFPLLSPECPTVTFKPGNCFCVLKKKKKIKISAVHTPCLYCHSNTIFRLISTKGEFYLNLGLSKYYQVSGFSIARQAVQSTSQCSNIQVKRQFSIVLVVVWCLFIIIIIIPFLC